MAGSNLCICMLLGEFSLVHGGKVNSFSRQFFQPELVIQKQEGAKIQAEGGEAACASDRWERPWQTWHRPCTSASPFRG